MTHYPSPGVALTTSDLSDNPSLCAYLKNVRDRHGYIRLLGLADGHDSRAWPIDKMYVPVELESQSARQSVFDAIAEAVVEHKPLLVLGDAGSGKTTLLDSLIWQLSRPGDSPLVARHGWRLPVPMVLRELRLAGVQTFEDLLGSVSGAPDERTVARELRFSARHGGSWPSIHIPRRPRRGT